MFGWVFGRQQGEGRGSRVGRLLILLEVMIASLLAAAACTPPPGSEGSNVATVTGESGSVQSGNSGGGVVIEVTPM